MTKTDFQTLKDARTILDRLSDTERKDESFPSCYRNAIGNTEDEIGMLILCIEENPSVFTHPYWNEELADVVNKGNTSKEITYVASIERETNGDYQLSFVSEQDEEDDLDGNYQNYVTEDDAKADIAELIKAGYKIKFED